MSFSAKNVLPGVWQIQDAMGVCMTLLTGESRALLIDTGYGLEDVAVYVRSLTELSMTVLLTHCHHDHALGARWFPETWMFPEDAEAFTVYTGTAQRERVLESAKAKGLSTDDGFLTQAIPLPRSMTEQTFELGGLTARVMHCPGHTPGSAVVYVPERRLLLTGDDWNPTTWLFFPEALPAGAYLRNVRRLLALPFEHALCSHQPALYPREAVESFLNGLTEETLRAAEPVDIAPYEAIDTRRAVPAAGQQLVFDWAKANLNERKDDGK